jgi:hypothetical protein
VKIEEVLALQVKVFSGKHSIVYIRDYTSFFFFFLLLCKKYECEKKDGLASFFPERV